MKSYVLLAGGGKVGYYLARTLKDSGYFVGVIERDPARAAMVAADLEVTVVCGDATEPGILLDADAPEARYMVAVTGSDETNLAICQMAKSSYGVRETIARVINPKNEVIMKRLGVDATISTTAVAAETIKKVLPAKGMRLSQIFSQGDVEMAELELESDSPALGKTVSELVLPEDCLLISLIRDGVVSFPRGRTVLERGDRVFALSRLDAVEGLRKALQGGDR